MNIVTTKEQLQHAVKELSRATVVAYDLETSGLSHIDNVVLIIALATETAQYAIDVRAIGANVAFACVKPILESKSILKLAHNAAFDARFALQYNVICTNMYDTMLVERMLSAGLNRPEGFSLKSLANRYCGIALEKEVRSEFIDNPDIILEDRHFAYALSDVAYLFAIRDQQLPQIKAKGLETTFDLEMSLIPCTALMEYTGITLNKPELESLIPPFQAMVKSAERALQDLFISHGAASHILFTKDGYSAVNLNSKPGKRTDKETGQTSVRYGQVYTAFKELGLTPTNKKGGPSLNAKDVLRWDMKHNQHKEYDYSAELDLDEDEGDLAAAIKAFDGLKHPVLRAFAFYIAATKILDSYILGTLEKYNPTTGRVYGWFSQLGARSTGRYSSDLQQIPQDSKLKRLSIPHSIRGCFIAPPGRKLLIADYSGIELVILADLSGDVILAQLIVDSAADKDDIHLYVVRQAFTDLYPNAINATLENKKVHPFPYLRDAAKPTSYGIAYGITGNALSETISDKLGPVGIRCDATQAQTILDNWKRNAFPQAGQWLDQTSRYALVRGYSETASGRKRWYDLEYARLHEWKKHAIMREGSNQPIQGACADIMKRAMRYLFERLDMKRARIIWTVHDELIIEATDPYVETAKALMKACMEVAAQELLPRMGKNVIVKVNVSQKYDK